MRVTNKIRNPYTKDIFTNVDVITTVPTTTTSRASLLLLNDQFKWMELIELADKLNINLSLHDIEGYGHARNVLLTIIRHNFFDRKETGKSRHKVLKCEYCNSRVYRDIKQGSDRLATVDHKNPQFEGFDALDDSNFAVACHRCNQAKNKMPYEEWYVIYKKTLLNNEFELNRVKKIGNYLDTKTSEIFDNDNTQVNKFSKIAKITEYLRDFLIKHLNNLDLDPVNITKSKEDIKVLTRLNIIANHKIKIGFDKPIFIEKELKRFFHTNKDWSRITMRSEGKKI